MKYQQKNDLVASAQESIMFVEELYFVIPPDEQDEIKKMLNIHKINLVFFEKRKEPVASLFDAISIYLNEHLVSLIVAGIMPVVYDAIKSSVLCLLKHIKKLVVVSGSGKHKEASLKFNFRIGNIEINAPIPKELSDDQFSIYMEMLRTTIMELGTSKKPNEKAYDCLVIELNNDNMTLNVKTIVQHIREKREEQSKDQMRRDK